MRGTAQGTLCGGQLVGLTGVAEDLAYTEQRMENGRGLTTF